MVVDGGAGGPKDKSESESERSISSALLLARACFAGGNEVCLGGEEDRLRLGGEVGSWGPMEGIFAGGRFELWEM